jgi:hypothetical protein
MHAQESPYSTSFVFVVHGEPVSGRALTLADRARIILHRSHRVVVLRCDSVYTFEPGPSGYGKCLFGVVPPLLGSLEHQFSAFGVDACAVCLLARFASRLPTVFGRRLPVIAIERLHLTAPDAPLHKTIVGGTTDTRSAATVEQENRNFRLCDWKYCPAVVDLDGWQCPAPG